MKTRHVAAGAIALLMFAATPSARAASGQAGEQAKTDQKSTQTQFTAQDRQATSDWYGQHQANPPAGFRQQDKLTADQDSRLQVGSKLDPDLLKLAHAVPSDLKVKLATPAPGYRYASVGGQVTLLDKQNQVHDIIRHP